jgi:hypothetical protein
MVTKYGLKNLGEFLPPKAGLKICGEFYFQDYWLVILGNNPHNSNYKIL